MGRLQACVIALVALILTPGLQFYFDVTPKVVVVLAGTAALLIWHVWRRAVRLPAGGAFGGGGDSARAERRTDSPPQAASLPYINIFAVVILADAVSLTVSSALSRDPALSWFGTNWRRFGAVEEIAILVFAWLLARYGSVRTMLRGIAVAGIAAAAYGIAQYFGWDPILDRPAYHVGEGVWTIVRPPGTFGYTSYFATWLVVTAFLGAGLAAMETTRWWRGVAWTSAALSLAAMFLNGTRAALVGLAAGGAVWICGRGFRRGRRLAAGLAVAGLVIVTFYISPAGLQLRSRMRWFIEDPWGGGRGPLWRDSLAMAWHRPVVGFGPEVFTAAFPAYESAQLTRKYPDFSYQSPHNMFLDALVAQGIPGLLAVCALCWIGFRGAWRAKHPAGLLLGAALAAGVISQQFTVMTAPTALLIFSAAAMGVGLDGDPNWQAARNDRSRQAAGNDRSRQAAGNDRSRQAARNDRSRQAAKGDRLSYVMAGSAAAIFLFVAVRLAAADYALAAVQRDLNAGRVREAAGRFAQYERWRLPGTSADLWYSRASAKAAQGSGLDPATRVFAMSQYGSAALRATEADEQPFDAWYSASQYYALENDAAGVERSLRASIAARPNWFKPHWAFAQLLRLENRLPEADREAALARDLDGGAHPEVIATWREIHRAASRSTEPLHK